MNISTSIELDIPSKRNPDQRHKITQQASKSFNNTSIIFLIKTFCTLNLTLIPKSTKKLFIMQMKQTISIRYNNVLNINNFVMMIMCKLFKELN